MPKRLFTRGDPWTLEQKRKAVEARRAAGTQHVITAEERRRGAKKAAAARRAADRARRAVEASNLAKQALLEVRGEIDPVLLARVTELVRGMVDAAYFRGAKAERIRAFRQRVRDKQLRLDGLPPTARRGGKAA